MARPRQAIWTECLHVGRPEPFLRPWAYVTLVLGVLLALVLVGIGLLILTFTLGRAYRCPRCKREGTMIDVNAPEAAEYMRQASTLGRSAPPRSSIDDDLANLAGRR